MTVSRLLFCAALLVSFAFAGGCIDQHVQTEFDDDALIDEGADALDRASRPDAELDAAPDVSDSPDVAEPSIPPGIVQVGGDDARPTQFSADGRVLLFTRGERRWLHYLPTGVQVDLGVDDPGFASLSPDGRTVTWLQAGPGGPQAGLSLWTPGEPESLAQFLTERPAVRFFADGRFIAEPSVVFRRVDAAAPVEVLTVDAFQFTDFHPSPDTPASLMLTSRAEEGAASWLLDLQGARAWSISDEARFIAWSGRHLVYSETARGPVVARDRADGSVLRLEVSDHHGMMISDHDPPMAAFMGVDGTWVQRIGAAAPQLLGADRPTVLGWVGDEVLTQVRDGARAVQVVNVATGVRRVIDGTAGQRYRLARDSRYLHTTVERADVQHHQRFDWASGARIEVGRGRVVETNNPDVYVERGEVEVLVRIRNGRVERREAWQIEASPNGEFLSLRDSETLSALNLGTLAEQEIYPAALPAAPLREHVLGNGVFAVRVGPDGGSSLWVGPLR